MDNENSELDCEICYEEMTKIMAVTSEQKNGFCNHNFCENCITSHIRRHVALGKQPECPKCGRIILGVEENIFAKALRERMVKAREEAQKKLREHEDELQELRTLATKQKAALDDALNDTATVKAELELRIQEFRQQIDTLTTERQQFSVQTAQLEKDLEKHKDDSEQAKQLRAKLEVQTKLQEERDEKIKLLEGDIKDLRVTAKKNERAAEEFLKQQKQRELELTMRINQQKTMLTEKKKLVRVLKPRSIRALFAKINIGPAGSTVPPTATNIATSYSTLGFVVKYILPPEGESWKGSLLDKPDSYERLERRGSRLQTPVWKGRMISSGNIVCLKAIPIEPYVLPNTTITADNTYPTTTTTTTYQKTDSPTTVNVPSDDKNQHQDESLLPAMDKEEYLRSHRFYSSFREPMFLYNINHPNIISLQKILRSSFEIQLVLPFSGCDLGYHCTSIDENAYNLQWVQYIIYRVLGAIKYLHSAEVVHRDIKSTSILYRPEKKKIKLTSFGNARSLRKPYGLVLPTKSQYSNDDSEQNPNGGSIASNSSTDHYNETSRSSYLFSKSASLLSSFSSMVWPSTVSGTGSSTATTTVSTGTSTPVNVTTQPPKLNVPTLIGAKKQPQFDKLPDPDFNMCYWSPELALLEERNYAIDEFDYKKCDIWAIGCLMAELLRRGEPLFKKKNAQSHFTEIMEIEECYPFKQTTTTTNTNTSNTSITSSSGHYLKNPNFPFIPKGTPITSMKKLLTLPVYDRKRALLVPIINKTQTPELSESAYDLLKSMLAFDPSARPSVDQLLLHPFFKAENMPGKQKMEVKVELDATLEQSHKLTDDFLVEFAAFSCGGPGKFVVDTMTAAPTTTTNPTQL